MPALYMPIILMLLGLIFRGVAFEYRWRTVRWRPVWDFAFTAGSIIAALCQGIALGALVQGIKVVDRAYAGGWWDWLTGFSVLTGIAVVFGYMLLGATWLVMKTDGGIQVQMRFFSWTLAAITLTLIGLVSILTPLQNPAFFDRWFTWPQMGFSIIVPILVIYAAYRLFRGLNDHKDASPFLSSLAIFILCYIGIGISFYPNIVPPSLSIHEAAAPDASLSFALYGTAVLVPMILAYTAYAYWVFRGKVDPSEGYH
jgi:cytochrome d ubiquinol oxidase subunit II